jgi:serine/threonine-protein kinase HipA
MLDRLYLWYLASPQQPRLIGGLKLVDDQRSVGLQYASEWLQSGFALSDDVPLTDSFHIPTDSSHRDGRAAGAVDDARPDRWGERVIRFIERPARLSLLEYLYFAGDARFGALGVSSRHDAYTPHAHSALPVLSDVSAVHRIVQQVLAGEAVEEHLKRLIQPGATLGGARPKSLLEMDGKEWVLKFAEEAGNERGIDEPLIEHATMRLAERCGIHVAATRAIPLASRRSKIAHAIAIERFDRGLRSSNGLQARVHALSAHVALSGAGEVMGYPELAQWFRRRCKPAEIAAQQHELFRRMVFNILIDNTDDHEKNHAVLRDADGFYRLSPAFDVLPMMHGLGYQQMRVGRAGHESSIDNALSESSSFGLKLTEAKAAVGQIQQGLAGWQAFFLEQGVNKRDVDEVAYFVKA